MVLRAAGLFGCGPGHWCFGPAEDWLPAQASVGACEVAHKSRSCPTISVPARPICPVFRTQDCHTLAGASGARTLAEPVGLALPWIGQPAGLGETARHPSVEDITTITAPTRSARLSPSQRMIRQLG